MKKQFIMLAIIFIHFVSFGQSQKTKSDSSKVSYYKAYDELKNMLEGKETLNYEKAVFITENAYHNNYFNYKDFKRLIDFHASIINAYAKDVRTSYKEKYKGLRSFEQHFFKSNTDNWAIFKYITDTAFVKINKDTYYRNPYTYTYQDPYGSNKWENTQVLFLLLSKEKQGNCYSLAVLFKLFSDRLKSDARLTITPHHIYIQNRNARGDFNNVELASKTFPGDGIIQTLTYTTRTSIMNGMAQRMLSDKEAIALNLIYLAKSYQHKYNDNTNEFLLQCADLAFKYDTLSLNALLLKDEVTENRLLAAMKENNITKLSKARLNPQTQKLLKSHEEQLSNLYALGYREIPKDIEHIIIDNIQHRNRGNIYKDNTPNPFASIKAKQRYATLSNGMFDEMHEPVDTIQYYHALLNTKTKKIIKLLPIDSSDDYKVDPVVFALSVDPMTDKYPNISPYAYCAWNPIMLVDPNGTSTNPIYDFDGNFLGSDDKGLKGEAIIMDKNNFKQGMSHDEAMQKGTTFSNLPKVINPSVTDKIKNHFDNLPNRPDYNNYVISRSLEEMKNSLPPSGQTDYSPVNVESFLLIGSLGKTILSSIVKEGFNELKNRYADRVRERALQDPKSHNFPYSFDNVILDSKPNLKPNGYQIFQSRGTMNGIEGNFEIGVNNENIIDHRFFRPF